MDLKEHTEVDCLCGHKRASSEVETYFHYVIKAGLQLFGEDEVRATLNRFIRAVWEDLE